MTRYTECSAKSRQSGLTLSVSGCQGIRGPEALMSGRNAVLMFENRHPAGTMACLVGAPRPGLRAFPV